MNGSTVRRRWRLNFYRWPDPRTSMGVRFSLLVRPAIGLSGNMFPAVAR
jgi:hypothetical protein